jgi:hypothetical protein
MRQLAGFVVLIRVLGLISLALLAVALSACQASQTPLVTPVAGVGVIAQPSQVDLGRVPFDQQVDARFTLINRGTTVVHLDQNVEVQALEGC